MNTLYLIRHAENQANLTKEFSCRLIDYGLTPRGHAQAAQVAAYLRTQGIHELITSPLIRAQQTAASIGAACGLTPVVMEQFREINVGTLETQPPTAENWAYHNAVLRGWFTGQPDVRFPDGEDLPTLVARIRDGLTRIVQGKRDRNIVIVGHVGAFTCALPSICPGTPITDLVGHPYQNAAISEITLTLDGAGLHGTLRRWADHAHLSGDAAAFVSALPDEK